MGEASGLLGCIARPCRPSVDVSDNPQRTSWPARPGFYG